MKRARAGVVRGILGLVLVFVFFPACKKGGGSGFKQPPSAVPARGFFPLQAGDTLKFSGGTGVGAEPIPDEQQEWGIEDITAPDGKPGFKISRKGRGLLNAMEMIYGDRDEGIVTWSGTFGSSKTSFDPPLVELPATIVPHAKWSWSGTSKGVPFTVESELEGLEMMNTPMGKRSCLRISRKLGAAGTLTQWYAEGLGIVAAKMKNPGGRIEIQRVE